MLQRKHLAWAVDMFPTARKCGIRLSKKSLDGYVCQYEGHILERKIRD